MAKICPACGTPVGDDPFCDQCGAPLSGGENVQAPQPAAPYPGAMSAPPPPAPGFAPPPQAPAYAPVAAAPQALPPQGEYAMISTPGYVGISLLLCIPIVNLILLILWACGGCKKLQKRNFARATLFMWVLTAIVLIVLYNVVAGFIVTVLTPILNQGVGNWAASVVNNWINSLF